MFNSSLNTTTSPKLVIPFYGYATAAFLVSCLLLFLNSNSLTNHYFLPKNLALVHTMALGWGTMIILGASHQLLPVLIENKLYSEKLAKASFLFAALGIPLLIWGFYFFNLGWLAQTGALLIIMAVVCYLVNCAKSMVGRNQENIHAVFVFTATIWLLVTCLVGFLLLLNFTQNIFSQNSLYYLSLHAHLGMLGWFVLMVIGIGSRLIPMFLISKYENSSLLQKIYYLLNISLISFIFIYLFAQHKLWFYVPVFLFLVGLILFIKYCAMAYRQRIRKKVDEQVKLSLLSVVLLLLPTVLMVIIILQLLLTQTEKINVIITYGFMFFFGWLTAIIMGMTFKTLPFIVWNKQYHALAGKTKTPNPKDLFSQKIFNLMAIAYLTGFILFSIGTYFNIIQLMKLSALLLVIAAILYAANVIKLIFHQPKTI